MVRTPSAAKIVFMVLFMFTPPFVNYIVIFLKCEEVFFDTFIRQFFLIDGVIFYLVV